jgi:hypothetical protein
VVDVRVAVLVQVPPAELERQLFVRVEPADRQEPDRLRTITVSVAYGLGDFWRGELLTSIYLPEASDMERSSSWAQSRI